MYKYTLKIMVIIAITGIASCGQKSVPNTPDTEQSKPQPQSKIIAQANKNKDHITGTKSTSPDLINGRRQFSKCKVCHTLLQGERNKVGPNLYGLLNRPAASLEGFRYSAALKQSALVWDQPSLDTWINNPRKMVPGTSMSFVGVRDEQSRKDLLAYILEQTAGPATKTQ